MQDGFSRYPVYVDNIDNLSREKKLHECTGIKSSVLKNMSEYIFLKKSFENSQGIFYFYKGEILLWLLFFCKFCPTTGKM